MVQSVTDLSPEGFVRFLNQYYQSGGPQTLIGGFKLSRGFWNGFMGVFGGEHRSIVVPPINLYLGKTEYRVVAYDDVREGDLEITLEPNQEVCLTGNSKGCLAFYVASQKFRVKCASIAGVAGDYGLEMLSEPESQQFTYNPSSGWGFVPHPERAEHERRELLSQAFGAQ